MVESDSGAFIGNLTTLDPTQASSSYRSLVRRPGRNECLTGSEDGVPRLYNVSVAGTAGGALARTYEKLKGRVEALAFSADGAQFAAGGTGGAVRVYGTDNGGAVATLEVPGTVFALAFQPDGKVIAVAGLDGKVRLFDLPAGKLVKEFVPVPLVPAK